jgi:archaellin
MNFRSIHNSDKRVDGAASIAAICSLRVSLITTMRSATTGNSARARCSAPIKLSESDRNNATSERNVTMLTDSRIV